MTRRATTTTDAGAAVADSGVIAPAAQVDVSQSETTLSDLQHTVGNRSVGRLLSGVLQTKLRIGPAGDSFEREADRMADTVLRMPTPEAGEGGAIGQVAGSPIQRVCAECEEELRRQPMEEEEEFAQREATSADSGGEAPPSVQLKISTLHGRGQPMSPSLRSFFEPRFNQDFGAVRLHTGSTAAASASAMKARAFTVGKDIAFNAGEYAPQSHSGRRLLAHELTHVVQQTPLVARRAPLIQRQVEPAAQQEVPSPEPEQTPPTQEATPVPDEQTTPETTPAPGLLVEDGETELGPGQLTKSTFLAELRTGICSAAHTELAGTSLSAQGCPTIELYLRFYDGLSAARIEQDLVSYVPEAAGATDARQYIPLAAARVARSVASWVETGEITGVPEGLPTGLPGLSALAGLLFKARPGGPRGNPNPQAVQAQLGPGRPLSSTVNARMGSAFGRSFSNVRVHTDSTARRLNSRHNARAFTVGNHVAFGAGEYRPGTMIGDALIAHELAHTVQQQYANTKVAPLQAGTSGTGLLERDADRSAVGAVATLWNGIGIGVKEIAGNVVPQLRSGLNIQRCAATTPTPALPQPIAAQIGQDPSQPCTAQERQSGDPDKKCCTPQMISEIESYIGQGTPLVGEAISRLSNTNNVSRQLWAHFRVRPGDSTRIDIIRDRFQSMQNLMGQPNDVSFYCADGGDPLCAGKRARASNCQSSLPVIVQLCGDYVFSQEAGTRYLMGEDWLKTFVHEYAHLSCRSGGKILDASRESYMGRGQRPYPPENPDLAVKNPDSYANFALDR